MSMPLPFKNAQEIKNLKNEREFFEWTPEFSCQTESEAPTATYNEQFGYGCKIKLNNEVSIVFVTFVIYGYIKQISTGNNYATIKGLPYSQSLSYGYSCINFQTFMNGIDTTHNIPTGRFSSKSILIQNATPPTRGAAVEKWVASENNEVRIFGSGFYFTKD